VEPRSAFKAFAFGAASLAVGALTSAGPVRELDREVFATANRDRGPNVDRFFRGVTELGSIWASVGAAGVLAAAGRRRAAARGLAAASVAWVAGQGLKRLFLRPRPYDADLPGSTLRIGPPNGTSWPSSHPAVLLAFVTVGSRELGASRGARAALDIMTGAVGLSRVYVGVHYPSDVAGGLLLGKSVAAAFESEGRSGGSGDRTRTRG